MFLFLSSSDLQEDENSEHEVEASDSEHSENGQEVDGTDDPNLEAVASPDSSTCVNDGTVEVDSEVAATVPTPDFSSERFDEELRDAFSIGPNNARVQRQGMSEFVQQLVQKHAQRRQKGAAARTLFYFKKDNKVRRHPLLRAKIRHSLEP